MGCAGLLVRGSHVDGTSVFAGARTIRRHPTSPARAVAGHGLVGVAESLVVDVGVGVAVKRPDLADGLAHRISG